MAFICDFASFNCDSADLIAILPFYLRFRYFNCDFAILIAILILFAALPGLFVLYILLFAISYSHRVLYGA
jgi:hypothetical protein